MIDDDLDCDNVKLDPKVWVFYMNYIQSWTTRIER
jgi:hypothetical protein